MTALNVGILDLTRMVLSSGGLALVNQKLTPFLQHSRAGQIMLKELNLVAFRSGPVLCPGFSRWRI